MNSRPEIQPRPVAGQDDALVYPAQNTAPVRGANSTWLLTCTS